MCYNFHKERVSYMAKILVTMPDEFLTKVDGDIEHNNFLSSLKKIK